MERYERFREEGWKSYEDSAKVISFFRKRKQGEQPVSGKIYTPLNERIPTYDKSYDIQLVIRLMKDKMMTKRLTRTPSGQKKRLTPRKDFLTMKPYDVYDWVSLINEVRNAIRDGEDSILLSNQEIKMIS